MYRLYNFVNNFVMNFFNRTPMNMGEIDRPNSPRAPEGAIEEDQKRIVMRQEQVAEEQEKVRVLQNQEQKQQEQIVEHERFRQEQAGFSERESTDLSNSSSAIDLPKHDEINLEGYIEVLVVFRQQLARFTTLGGGKTCPSDDLKKKHERIKQLEEQLRMLLPVESGKASKTQPHEKVATVLNDVIEFKLLSTQEREELLLQFDSRGMPEGVKGKLSNPKAIHGSVQDAIYQPSFSDYINQLRAQNKASDRTVSISASSTSEIYSSLTTSNTYATDSPYNSSLAPSSILSSSSSSAQQQIADSASIPVFNRNEPSHTTIVSNNSTNEQNLHTVDASIKQKGSSTNWWWIIGGTILGAIVTFTCVATMGIGLAIGFTVAGACLGAALGKGIDKLAQCRNAPKPMQAPTPTQGAKSPQVRRQVSVINYPSQSTKTHSDRRRTNHHQISPSTAVIARNRVEMFRPPSAPASLTFRTEVQKETVAQIGPMTVG